MKEGDLINTDRSKNYISSRTAQIFEKVQSQKLKFQERMIQMFRHFSPIFFPSYCAILRVVKRMILQFRHSFNFYLDQRKRVNKH